MRYELTDHRAASPGWTTGAFSTASFGCCARARLGGDLAETFGPYTTCYNRFVRWRGAGVCSEIMNAPVGCLHRPQQKTVHGPVTRRVDQQDTCGRRYQWPSGSAGTDSR
jgi:transposase